MEIGHSLREAHAQGVDMAGETFDIVRGEHTHQASGLRDDNRRVIDFLHDSDVQAGDIARGVESGETFHIEHVRREVAGDMVIYLIAHYDTDYHRAQRQANAQPTTTVTIGTVYSSVLNIESQLSHVTQQIGALTQADTETKQALADLVAQLKDTLKDTPPAQADDAAVVSKRVDAVVQEAAAAKPDPDVAAVNLESLKKAATNLAAVLPDVLPIAMQIIDRIRPLVGI